MYSRKDVCKFYFGGITVFQRVKYEQANMDFYENIESADLRKASA